MCGIQEKFFTLARDGETQSFSVFYQVIPCLVMIMIN